MHSFLLREIFLKGLGETSGGGDPNVVLKSSTGCSFILCLSTAIQCDFLVDGGFVCNKAGTFSHQIEKAFCIWV